MKLSRKALKAVKWSSISQFSRQIIQYLTTLILANILSPNDFGLIALALVITGFIEIFKDLGTSSALIYLNEVNELLISSIFWFNIILGFFFTLLIFLSSNLISSFFNSEDVVSILRVLSIVFIISGFSILPKTLLERELQFNKLALVEIVSVIVGSSTGIILAYLGFGVWSLIFQILANNLVFTILVLINKKIKPVAKISFKSLKSVSNYSLNLIGYNVFNYFVRNADYMLIGKYLGENQLGNYYLAYKIMLYPLQSITVVVSRVMFPIFSRLKNDINKFRKVYLRTTHIIAFFTFPMIIGMMVVSKYFVFTFFSHSWDTTLLSNLIIILAPVGLIQSLSATTGSIYMATGKTNWMFGWGVFSGIITIAGFIIGLNYGVIGVAISYLIVTLILFYPVFYFPFKFIKLNFLKFINNFWQISFFSILMCGILLLVKYLFLGESNYLIGFIVLVLLGMISYIIISRKMILDLIQFFKGNEMNERFSD